MTKSVNKRWLRKITKKWQNQLLGSLVTNKYSQPMILTWDYLSLFNQSILRTTVSDWDTIPKLIWYHTPDVTHDKQQQ